MIRKAKIEDLEELISVCKPYFYESFWGKNTKFSEEKTREKFRFYLTELNSFVVDVNGICGFAVVSLDYVFSEDLTADIEFFFVTKEARGSGVSRLLRDACADFAKLSGARIMCACSSSDVEDGLWVNLFKKISFQKLGTVMVKVL